MAITIIGLPWTRAAFNIASYTGFTDRDSRDKHAHGWSGCTDSIWPASSRPADNAWGAIQ
jgi:hypothetical protein